MKLNDKQARTLAALGIAVIYSLVLLWFTQNLTASLVMLAFLFVALMWILDALASNNPQDYDS